MNVVALLADLAAASSHARTRRALSLRIGAVLSSHVRVLRVEIVESNEGGPPCIERAARSTTLVVPVLEAGEPVVRVTIVLATGAGSELTDELVDPLAKVISAAVRQCLLIERVADLSRRAHVESADLRRRLDASRKDHEIVARSPLMLAALERLDLVAPHDTTVLLLGESGTGKELFARRLHARSPRAAAPFVQINCGAIPETLLESALFGHEAGAFTGATARHLGIFERANGGTLLLDEVGELPPPAQVKLLRVLQEGTIERVGGEKPLGVNVRIVAATHRPLQAMVEQGSFRADLYYRLDVLPIEIPPLRARREDVPLLVHHLLGSLAARLGLAVPAVSRETMRSLVERDWPGNVRELANALERALILSREGELVLDEPTSTLVKCQTSHRDAPGVRTLEAATRECIETALAACGGRLYGPDGAAAKLGLRPSTLQSKLLKYRISRTDFVR